MDDIFSSSDLDDLKSTDIFAGDSGSTPSGEPTGGAPLQHNQPDNVGSDATQTPAQPTDGAATASSQGQAGGVDTGQASSGAPSAGQQFTEDQLSQMEREAEAALNDERAPKWYKNVVGNVYRPKLEKLGSQVEQYTAFGTPEELTQRLALLDALNEIGEDPNTGMPIPTTANFVKTIYEQNPQTAYQLINDLATLPSPITQGLTVTEELLNQIGIDPRKLDDIRQFAQNGYSMTASAFAPPDAEDLAQIPQQYHATFAKLDPETRESLMSDNERVRNINLEGHRIRIQNEENASVSEEQQRIQAEQQEQQQQAAFRARVEQEGEKNFNASAEALLNSFVDSLTNQAKLSSLEAMMISNTVLNALEPTLAGRKSLEVLKADGIEIDPAVPQLIASLQKLTKHAAYYQLVNDRDNLSTTVEAIQDRQEKLIAKANKIVAALALKRNGAVMGQAQQQGQQIAGLQNTRHAMAGTAVAGIGAGQPTANRDFSDEAYADEIARDPFFRRG